MSNYEIEKKSYYSIEDFTVKAASIGIAAIKALEKLGYTIKETNDDNSG